MTTLFIKGTSQEISKIKHLLTTYCSWSGQQINFHKSKAFLGKFVPSNIATIIHQWGIQHMTSSDLYRGYPFFAQSESKERLFQLTNKIRAHLPCWKAVALSQAGRMVLVKEVLSAIP